MATRPQPKQRKNVGTSGFETYSDPQPLSSLQLSTDGKSDFDFIDDLLAATRFKSFLLARGAEIPAFVIEGLALLNVAFKEDLLAHNIEPAPVPRKFSFWPFRWIFRRTT